MSQINIASHSRLNSTSTGTTKAFYGLALFVSLLFSCEVLAQIGPSFVPDRPSYLDATASVDRGHWHFELGGSYLPEQESTGSALLRYGLGKGWELRLMSPTLMQEPAYTDEMGNEINPDLIVGGTLFGGKWAKAFRETQFSVVTMVGLPLAGTSKAFSPDPLFLTKAQVSHQFNTHLSSGLALKYALTDGYIYGQSVAYAKELAHLFGMVGSLVWSDVGWSFFSQAGAELYAGTLIPLVGTGFTFRLTQGSQIDLSLDAPLTSDGPVARYMMGLTLAW